MEEVFPYRFLAENSTDKISKAYDILELENVNASWYVRKVGSFPNLRTFANITLTYSFSFLLQATHLSRSLSDFHSVLCVYDYFRMGSSQQVHELCI
jgi:hypothetical protein